MKKRGTAHFFGTARVKIADLPRTTPSSGGFLQQHLKGHGERSLKVGQTREIYGELGIPSPTILPHGWPSIVLANSAQVS